jgi:hypothetical protein
MISLVQTEAAVVLVTLEKSEPLELIIPEKLQKKQILAFTKRTYS